MCTGTESNHQETYSPADLIKALVSQVMRIVIPGQRESNLALSCAEFRTAENENWFELLGSVLAALSQICVIIDLEVLCLRSQQSTQHWPTAFMEYVRGDVPTWNQDRSQGHSGELWFKDLSKIAYRLFRIYQRSCYPSMHSPATTLQYKRHEEQVRAECRS